MRESDVFLETWTFICQHCSHIWQDEYEAHHLDGIVAWHHRGLLSMPPWEHATCLSCEGVSVKVLPRQR